MSWKYDPFNRVVKNTNNGAAFIVKKASSEDVQLEIISPPKLNRSEEDLLKLTAGASSAVQDDCIRMRMRELVNDHFPTSYLRAASIISKQTGHKVSERSIQAWLIDSDKPSSRRCPFWALRALEDYVSINPEKHEHQISYERDQEREFADLLDHRVVMLATDKITSDKKKRDAWNNCSLLQLTDKIFELEKRHEEHLWHLNDVLARLQGAICDASNFEDMKMKVSSAITRGQNINFAIRATRAAIEAGDDEFSNEEGVLK